MQSWSLKTIYKTKFYLGAAVLLVSLVAPLTTFIPQASAAVDTCTWTGGGADNDMSTASNWTGCDNGTVPENGDNLVFPAASESVIVYNDILTSVGTITILDGANPDNYTYALYSTVDQPTVAITANITIGEYQDFVLTSSTTFTNDVVVTLNNSRSSFTMSGPTTNLGDNTLTFSYAAFAGLSATSSKSELPIVNFLGNTSGLDAGSVGTSIVLNGVDFTWGNTGTTYIGDVIANKSVVTLSDFIDSGISSLGATSGELRLNQSQFGFSVGGPLSFTEPMVINGNLFGQTGSDLEIGYEAISNPSGGKLTLNDVTLLSDIAADPYSYNIEFAGSLTGRYLIGGSQVYTVDSTKGRIIVSATTNTSLLPNGDYQILSSLDPITDDLPSQDVIVEVGRTITINGTRRNVIVSSGGMLKGTGTVGEVSILGLATLAPGESPGCLSSGSLSFSPSAIYQVEIGGATVCTQYDQTQVTGTVNLTGATLDASFINDYVPARNTAFTIIANDGSDAVTGTFASLDDGATFSVDGYTVQINYDGGDGNDVVLLVTTVPAAPDTGLSMLSSNPLLPILAAGAMLTLLLAQRFVRLRK